MKNRSVKVKITLWITLLMLVLESLLLVFMLSISSTVARGSAMEQLQQTVRSNLPEVGMEDGKLVLGENFSFYRGGVYSLVYSKNVSLIAGQPPVTFDASVAFENGEIRTVDSGGSQYFVVDFWVASGWEDGVWVRGISETPNTDVTARNLTIVALIALPLFTALAALGGYRIVRRSLRPLDTITATATAINEARDLSRRIDLPPGRDEFSRLAVTFDALFERLERSFEAEKQFSADVSHELRTPVSIIKGACEYAAKYDETPEERRETVEMISRQAERMSEIISQMLSMTRLEQGTVSVDMKPYDLAELVRSACAERHYDETRLSLELESVTATVDAALISRLVTNLVDNAFKYGKPNGSVRVTLTGSGNEILLHVRDDGVGIPPEEQDKVWQRFYRADKARTVDDGSTGLGLSMVQRIAELHGGHMTLESEPEVGSVFTLHLPVKR